jgi:hypothetical protein
MSLKGELLTILQNSPRTERRAARAAGVGGDWSPAANFNIFNITGGPVKITGLWGHVVAVFAGANATPIVTQTPTGGAAANMSVIAVAAAFALNTFLVWDGSLTAVSGVLRASAAVGHTQSTDSVGTAGTAESWAGSIVVVPGIIRITNAGAADATGRVDWYCTWVPMTPQSVLVAIP